MGRPSKFDQLVTLIMEKQDSLVKGEIRVKKDVILSDKNLNLAKSTLYKLVKENNKILQLDRDEVVYNLEEMKREKYYEILKKIYSKYDPKIGQQIISLSSILDTHDSYGQEILEDLARLKYIALHGKKIKFTERGVRITQGECWRDQNEPLNQLCNICLKPLNEMGAIIGEVYNELFTDYIAYHPECNAEYEKQDPPYERTVCGYCGLPLTLYEYRLNLLHGKYQAYSPTPINTIRYLLKEDQNLILKCTIENYNKTRFTKFKSERLKFKEDTNSALGTLKAYVSKYKLKDPTNEILKSFFEDIHTGDIFERFNPDQILSLVMKYQIAEHEAQLAQEELIRDDIARFIDLTGVTVESEQFNSHGEPHVLGGSPVATYFPHTEGVKFLTYTMDGLLFHPKCFIRRYPKEEDMSN